MSQLLDRAAEGDADDVRALLAAHPETIDERGWPIDTTPLIAAAHRGRLEVVRVLLDAGADVHAREGASDSTALHWAACGGQPEVARALIDAGADLEARDAWYALGPLGWATVASEQLTGGPTGKREVAALLLDAGATPDSFSLVALGRADEVTDVAARLGPACDHDTLLHFAVRRGEAAAVAALVDKGADASAANDLGATPRALAVGTALRAALPGTDAVTAFLEGGDGAVRDELLHEVVRLASPEPTARLLARGVPVDVRVEAKCGDVRAEVTPLLRIAASGSVAIARALLAEGADPNVRMAGSELTPLHRAAAHGHVEMVDALLASGADPALRDAEFGATPAGWAEVFGHAALADRLAREVDGGA